MDFQNVWLSVGIVNTALCTPPTILTEDCDFYDPPFKNDAKQRERFIEGTAEGRLARFFRKKHGVVVQSVCLLAPR
jgi:hypothetical protein